LLRSVGARLVEGVDSESLDIAAAIPGFPVASSAPGTAHPLKTARGMGMARRDVATVFQALARMARIDDA
jgi:hypothetical protein